MFHIEFTGTSCGPKCLIARIVAPDLDESIWADLSYWNPHQYERQWHDGARRALDGQPSCLVVLLPPPDVAPYWLWWLLYPLPDGTIVMQNQIFLLADLSPKEKKDLDFYSLIPERLSEDPEGPISEWVLTRKDLRDFLDH